MDSKKSDFNLTGQYGGADGDYPFLLKGRFIQKRLNQHHVACQFNFLPKADPIFIDLNLDFSNPETSLIDLDLISFRNSHFDWIVYFLESKYQLFSNFQLLSSQVTFNAKLELAKRHLKKVKLKRFDAKNFEMQNLKENLYISCPRLRANGLINFQNTIDIKEGKVKFTKLDAQQNENQIVQEVDGVLEFANSQLKKMHAHSYNTDCEFQVDLEGFNQIGTFSYKGLLNKVPLFPAHLSALQCFDQKVSIQASLSKLSPHLRMLGGIDFLRKEKEERLDFIFDLENFFTKNVFGSQLIHNGQIWGRNLTFKTWKCPFTKTRELKMDGYFDLESTYVNSVLKTNLKISKFEIEKKGIKVKIPQINKAHILFDVKSKQLVGSVNLKETFLHTDHLNVYKLKPCKMHIYNDTFIIPDVQLEGPFGTTKASLNLNFDDKKENLLLLKTPSYQMQVKKDMSYIFEGEFFQQIKGSIEKKEEEFKFDLDVFETPLRGCVRPYLDFYKVECSALKVPIFIKNFEFERCCLTAFDIQVGLLFQKSYVPNLLELIIHVKKNSNHWDLKGLVSRIGVFEGVVTKEKNQLKMKDLILSLATPQPIPLKPIEKKIVVNLLEFYKGSIQIPFTKICSNQKDIMHLFDVELSSFSMKECAAKGIFIEKNIPFELFGKRRHLRKPTKKSKSFSYLHSTIEN